MGSTAPLVIAKTPSRGERLGGAIMSGISLLLQFPVWLSTEASGPRWLGSAVLAVFFLVGLGLLTQRIVRVHPGAREVTVLRNLHVWQPKAKSWPFERFLAVTLMLDDRGDSSEVRHDVGLRGLDHLDLHVDSFRTREEAAELATRLAGILELSIEEGEVW